MSNITDLTLKVDWDPAPNSNSVKLRGNSEYDGQGLRVFVDQTLRTHLTVRFAGLPPHTPIPERFQSVTKVWIPATDPAERVVTFNVTPQVLPCGNHVLTGSLPQEDVKGLFEQVMLDAARAQDDPPPAQEQAPPLQGQTDVFGRPVQTQEAQGQAPKPVLSGAPFKARQYADAAESLSVLNAELQQAQEQADEAALAAKRFVARVTELEGQIADQQGIVDQLSAELEIVLRPAPQGEAL